MTDRNDAPAYIRMPGMRCSDMAMNETIRETMRQELVNARSGLGLGVGVFSFLGLCFLVASVPGLATFVDGHDWIYIVIIILSLGAGGIAGSMQEEAVWREIKSMDDDTLKFRHDELSRKKQRSSFVFYIVVALVVAYFIFRK